MGRPITIRVFPGNTADPRAFIDAVDLVRDKFGLRELTLVGDRGMITSARIEALKELGGLSWITCLRGPAIKALAADDGPLQMSLFDTQDLAEISHPDYPGERLIACRNPVQAQARAAKRDSMLAATEALLATLTTRVQAGRLAGADAIGVALGKVIDRYKMAKHLTYQITDTALSYQRNQASITTEAALDGIYVIRTSVPAQRLDAPARSPPTRTSPTSNATSANIKTDDLDLRPIHHYLTDQGPRPRADLHARPIPDLAPTPHPGTTDLHPPQRDNPVIPGTRSQHANGKAGRHTDTDHNPLHSFRGLLGHLATLTRNTITLGDRTFDKITVATPTQHRAFQLLGGVVPLTVA